MSTPTLYICQTCGNTYKFQYGTKMTDFNCGYEVCIQDSIELETDIIFRKAIKLAEEHAKKNSGVNMLYLAARKIEREVAEDNGEELSELKKVKKIYGTAHLHMLAGTTTLYGEWINDPQCKLSFGK